MPLHFLLLPPLFGTFVFVVFGSCSLVLSLWLPRLRSLKVFKFIAFGAFLVTAGAYLALLVGSVGLSELEKELVTTVLTIGAGALMFLRGRALLRTMRQQKTPSPRIGEGGHC